MANNANLHLEFKIIDYAGKGYHMRVSDVHLAFVGKYYITTISPLNEPTAQELSEKTNANALIYLRRHVGQNILKEQFGKE